MSLKLDKNSNISLEDKKRLIKLLLNRRKTETLSVEQGIVEEKDGSLFTVNQSTIENKAFPLSYNQKGLWTLYQIDSDDYANNMPFAFKINGTLNSDILKTVFKKIVTRHSSLRTRFATQDNEVVQIIKSKADFEFERADLRHLENNIVDDYLKRKSRIPFNLEKGPLFRAYLITCSRDIDILMIVTHHIVCDGISSSILFNELFEHYKGEAFGLPVDLPSLNCTYIDFVKWQREILSNDKGRECINYWTEKLPGKIPPLNLSYIHTPLETKTKEGEIYQTEISESLSANIRKASIDEKVSISILLFTVFKALLFRYTMQEDIVVGTPIEGRPAMDHGNTIGYYANVLPIRTRINGNMKGRDLLHQVRKNIYEGIEYGDFPFVELAKQLKMNPGKDHSPVFQITFQFQSWMGKVEHEEYIVKDRRDSKDINLEWEPLYNIQQSGTFDIYFEVIEKENNFIIFCKYNPDLYERDYVARISTHYQNLLKGIIQNLDLGIGDIPFISDREKKTLLYDYNDTHANYPKNQCIHEIFESRAEKNPFADAVIFKKFRISYKNLNVEANRLARHLIKRGMTPGSMIAICLDTSIDMIVSILAVLKSGCAYLPIDPDYPVKRKRFMMQDAKITHLISTELLFDKFPSLDEKPVFLDQDKSAIDKQPSHNLSIHTDQGSIAYCIYTSGSTGKPKGVLIDHKNVVRLLFNDKSRFSFTETDVWTMFHSYSFDFSVWEMYGALLFGGKLVLVSKETRKDPALFTELLASENITVLNQTPSAFIPLSKEILRQGIKALSLRYVIFGGESLTPLQLKPWKIEFPGVKLINMYGITETTVHVTFKEITEDEIDRNVNNIGTPIPTTTTYILDSNLNLLPVGVVGEICVGGDGVGRGYLNRDELTSKKFVKNPFRSDDLMYRSGDLGKLLPNGHMIHLGRMDEQVQIRGFRVELGEIKSHLIKYPLIHNAEVVVHDGNATSKMLTAYIESDKAIPLEDIRSYLHDSLPEHMIPAAFVFLDKFPLTSNGKVDRKAFPEPDFGKQIDSGYIAPGTTLEKTLAKIWSEALNIEKVGIEDNFFSIGGDSILAIQIVSLCQKENIAINVMDLFKNPTIKTLSDVIGKGDSEKEEDVRKKPFELISGKERKRLGENIVDAYPLSNMQMGMIFHSELEDNSGIYHDIFSYYLKGTLDKTLFRKALSHIIEQQPLLRTSFEFLTDKYIQKVHKTVEIPLSNEDISHLTPSGQNTRISNWFESSKTQIINWKKEPPLFHIHIFKRSSDSFQYCLSLHHAILDGWSVAYFNKTLFSYYFKLQKKQNLPLHIQEIKTIYRDFIELEQKAVESRESRRYWLGKLTHLEMTRLPRTIESKNNASNFNEVRTYENKAFSINSNTLTQIIRETGIPIKALLLTIHIKVLSSLSGKRDVVTGLVSNSRPEAEYSEQSLGLYLNTLPFRIKLKNESWEELAKRIHEQEVEMLAHRRFPLQVMQIEHDFELDEIAFNYIHYHVYKELSESDEFTVLNTEIFEQSNFNLLLNFIKSIDSDEVNLSMIYDTGQFEASEIEKLYGYYVLALKHLQKDIKRSHDKASLLSESEKKQLLYDWNETSSDYPRHQCIHHLFESRARKVPDSVALIFEDRQLTYQELNRRSNQLAHYLEKNGVREGMLVGLCIYRSADMLVGLMGILKTGAAYVPLDPTYPTQRLMLMIEDSKLSVLLTKENLVADFSKMTVKNDFRIFCLDKDRDNIQKESDRDPANTASPENIAYVIYTSGSTGKPKGVVITHRSVVNFLETMSRAPGLSDKDVLTAVTTISFDIAVLEIFLPFYMGAKVILVSREDALDALKLIKILDESGSTIMQATPATYRLLLSSNWKGNNGLKLLCGGEALPRELSEKMLEKGSSVWNMYGPTETTIWSSIFKVVAGTSHKTVESIGIPIANTQFYILDEYYQIVPVGVYGELLIGGDGLSHGYFNRPELTMDKFIANPFSEAHGSRLYRTGDLARYQKDGNVEFLGREDHQVKIRGFRIELGEIESLLVKNPFIKEALVIVKQNEDLDKQLVAYIVPESHGTIDFEKLRKSLKTNLPHYMVPQYIVPLEKMPLLPNGKINRKQLPEPRENPEKKQYIAPQTPNEKALGTVWAEVLKLEQIGIYENFFGLGGHSLLAVQVISRIRELFSQQVPIRLIFDHPTISGLAGQLEKYRQPSTSPGPPLVPFPKAEKIPLTYSQERLWFFDRLMPENPMYNIPVALRIQGDVDIGIFNASINEILKRHDILCANFSMTGGIPYQKVLSDKKIDLPVVNLIGVADHIIDETLRINMEEVNQKFNLANDALLRCLLLHVDENEFIFLLTMHHIISDAGSIAIFIEELFTIYDTFLSRSTISSAKPEVQYPDYAIWQREWLKSDRLEEQLSFWKEALDGADDSLEIPGDRPRPLIQSFNGGTVSIEIDQNLRDRLVVKGLNSNATLFMTTYAAFAALLYRYTHQHKIIVGIPIANRNRPETEGLIGFFANTLALCTNFADHLTFDDVMGQVREKMIAAQDNQDLPFEKLVSQLHPNRDLSRNPLIQVMFGFQNLPVQSIVLDDNIKNLTIDMVEFENTTVRFDLEVNILDLEDGMTINFTYNKDLFHRPTLERMATHYKNVIESIVDDSKKLVSELPVMNDGEGNQLLIDWNQTDKALPEAESIQAIFEEQVSLTPDAAAFSMESFQVTYDGLNKRANQLSDYLAAKGVKPEMRVGICMDRSVEMIVVLLGILKAGGVYVPIDPEYPEERVRFMMRDSQISMLLTQERFKETFRDAQRQNTPAGLEILCIDTIGATLAAHSTENQDSGTTSSNLAYVMYTSGSTGKPKAVEISHRGVIRLVKNTTYAGFDSRENFLQLAPLSFDASTFEIWGCLLNGARQVMMTPGTPSLEELGQTILNQNVSSLWLTSGLFNLMVENRIEDLRHVRQLLAGGDILSVPHVTKVVKDLKNCRLINGYGPTENTTFTCCYPVNGDNPINSSVPIGSPISNTRVYVLDARLQPVPIGIPGELYIGGEGLARCYGNSPQLTAQRFIPNPFNDSTRYRLYKTGDRVRFLPDGNIEFLGRGDHQVKISGFRIELTEIETVLASHPDVKKAVAIVHDQKSNDKRLVAYLVPAGGQTADSGELRDFLKKKLPLYMIPSEYVVLDTIPLTPNGKIDREELKKHYTGGQKESEFVAPEDEIEKTIAAVWEEVLGIENVSVHDKFFDIGGNSLLIIQIQSKLKQIHHYDLNVIDLFQYPTIRFLSQYLRKGKQGEPSALGSLSVRKRAEKNEPIAVIGMSGRFPGSKNIEAFWENLVNGVESITTFTDEELLASGVEPSLLKNPNYVKSRPWLDGIDMFDAEFFNYSPREAEVMDPQHRLFLECAWEALENAGYAPQNYNGRIGVFAGTGINSYFLNNLFPNPDLFKTSDPLQTMIMSDKDFLSTRVSYNLNLKGPSLNIQTACSTSLAAVHVACQSLLNNECDMALAGGVSISAIQKTGYLYQEGTIVSPDGHCRAFDAKANGTVVGSGSGTVVLKTLQNALKDHDRIDAVIRGSAINNDGCDKVGFTAPSVTGQAKVISDALLIAEVEAETITYLETHGTGTVLGDPIEMEALNQAFNHKNRPSAKSCAIGSVKTNMGHLDAAAGITGLIKTVLSIKHQQIPPNLHFENPNPKIDFENSPFYVNTELNPWETDLKRRAGVSSFGIGGTNVHVVMEEGPKFEIEKKRASQYLMVMSAKTETALEKISDNLLDYLSEHRDVDLTDVEFTLQTGRASFDHRSIIISSDREDTISRMTNRDEKSVMNRIGNEKPGIGFLFPEKGMTDLILPFSLCKDEPVFQRAVDHCAKLLESHLKMDIRDVIFSDENSGKPMETKSPSWMYEILLFVFEYALASYWKSLGVIPQMMFGSGVGEVVAGCMAGVFSLKDALEVIVIKSRSMEGGNDSVSDIFTHRLRKTELKKPVVPYISGTTGKWVENEEVMNPDYWVEQSHKKESLSAGAATIGQKDNLILLEVGPGDGFIKEMLNLIPANLNIKAFPSMKWNSKRMGPSISLNTLGRIWLSGVPLDWRGYKSNVTKHRIDLPTYPFERNRYWIDPVVVSHPSDDTQIISMSQVFHERPELPNIYKSAKKEVEAQITSIAEGVLGIKPIGIEDNFFELGADSLIATQFISRVKSIFQIEIPIKTFFENPTIRCICIHLSENNKQPDISIPKIVSRDSYPISSAQKRMLLIQQIHPASTSYNVPMVLVLEGKLDISRIEQAFQKLIDRHESLRTAFNLGTGNPSQKILSHLNFKIESMECSGNEVQETGEAFIRPFQLDSVPLFRVGLAGLKKDNHLLIIDMHHVITDGISIALLSRELLELYQGHDLPPLRIQYKDYATWQRSNLNNESLKKQKAYWVERFSDVPPILDLPTDYKRPIQLSLKGDSVHFSLGHTLSASLREFVRKTNTTLYMILLSLYGVLLYRYSGQKDILIGTPIANRRHLDLESIVGVFINTLVMRNFPDPEKEFTGFLNEVKETVLDAYENQDYPFEELVERVEPDRNLSHTPLFQVMFVLENMRGTEVELPELKINIEKLDSITSKYDLTLIMDDGEGEIIGALEYNTDLFQRASIERMVDHFVTLLKEVLNDSRKTISELRITTENENNQLLIDWNQTDKALPEAESIQAIFEEQVSLTPDAAAFSMESFQVTYDGLNKRANQLSDYLAAKGVKPEMRVGICMDRSVEMIVVLLGILKAGGVYVPIDPEYPEERVRFMMRDSQISMLLTQERFKETFRDAQRQNTPAGLEILCIDTIGATLAAHSTENQDSGTTSSNLAYVMYTSGSTGKPKAVEISHRGVIRLVKNTTYAGFDSRENFLQLAPLSFDASTFEIWGCLLNGARQVMMTPGTPSLEELGQTILNQNVSSLWLTSGLFNLMVENRIEDLRHVRQLLAGGDILSVPHVTKVVKDLKNCRLINGYGPTENTTFTCCYPVNGDNPINSSVPIGSPISNTRVYVLDARLQPVPIGIPGELYIGGEGLARCYGNSPQLTAQRFIPNPFNDSTRYRLYKTGDRVRFLPDGNIEFLGRGDHQVKISGFRIELTEIETVLASHPDVKKAVAIVHDQKSNDKRLVAYLVPAGGQTADSGELRDFLKKKLPLYMIPSEYVVLDTIPLTPNGKIDREELKKHYTGGQKESEFVAPEDEIEKTIAAVWEEVLGIENVSVHDKFFDIGGNSLLIIQIQSKLKQIHHYDLNVIDLFQYPTIRFLSQYLRKGKQGEPSALGSLSVRKRAEKNEPIAVIGMSGRFPGSKNIEAFWENLVNGVESITTFTDEELLASGVEPSLLKNPNYVKSRPWLDGIDMFDAEFFNYSPREAEVMDPQHRLFLECAWEALENAGYALGDYKEKVGVYASVGTNNYLFSNLISNPHFVASGDNFQTLISNEKDFLSTRVSYKLNLEGPSVNIQTACSSSLVAVHFACQGLLNYECGMALAGGISLASVEKEGYLYEKEGIASPDGHCRAFDANAQGTVGGSGLGIIVLKKLEQALKDGDHILAVVKGSAINNDGSLKVGYTAPSVKAQRNVISEAQTVGGVAPQSIGYIEAHGTGTALGDPIEIDALSQAFGTSAEKKGFCAIGSVKTNIGHLDTAAGIAGLIKTILALKHQKIPPSLHYLKPNPKIDFENSPFYVNSTLQNWKNGHLKRCAGVSAFGIGGTNAHVVIEEFDSKDRIEPSNSNQVLVISAKSENALEKATQNLKEFLERNADANLADVAYTLQVGRQHFDHRRMFVSRNREDAISCLKHADSKRVKTEKRDKKARIGFVFGEYGSLPINMAISLYERYPLFKEKVDRCAGYLKPYLNLDIRDVIYPTKETESESIELLSQKHINELAVFIIEYAMAMLLKLWGVTPQFLSGYGILEYTTACLAKVFSLEDTLDLILNRHHPDELFDRIDKIAMTSPKTPFISSVTGDWITEDQATSAGYWKKQADQTITLTDETHMALKERDNFLVELGPFKESEDSPQRRSQIHNSPQGHTNYRLDLSGKELETAQFMGYLWIAGAEINWDVFHTGKTRRRIPLPTYPFEYKKYWIAPSEELKFNASTTGGAEQVKKEAIEDWFYVPSFKRSIISHGEEYTNDMDTLYLIFMDKCGIGTALSNRLVQNKGEVITVTSRSKFTKVNDSDFLIDPEQKEDYLSLIRELKAHENKRIVVLHLWSITDGDKQMNTTDVFNKAQTFGFYSLLYLTQALRRGGMNLNIRIEIISNNLQEVTGEEVICPEKTTILGIAKVIPQEFLNIVCRNIDIVLPVEENGTKESVINQLINELAIDIKSPVVAYRGPYRHEQIFDLLKRKKPKNALSSIKRDGIYLITGGLGTIGLVLSKHLTEREKVMLILTGYSFFPERDDWGNWIETHPSDDSVSGKIDKIREMEQSGATVLTSTLDVSDMESMKQFILETESKYGKINGIIHAAGDIKDESFTLIQETEKAVSEGHFLPKAHGVMALNEIFGNEEIDFCYLFSSVSTVLGGLGFASYAAANQFMDAFANLKNKSIPGKWVSINWDAWQANGKSIDGLNEEQVMAIRKEEGMEAFNRIAASVGCHQIIVSVSNLEERHDKWIKGNILKGNHKKASTSENLYARPNLSTPYQAPSGDTENLLAGICQELLGIKQIGVQDNLFELGADSLMAVQFISRVHEAFQAEIQLLLLFENPTISELAREIERSQEEKHEKSVLKIKTQIDQMSEDEIRTLLKEKRNQSPYLS